MTARELINALCLMSVLACIVMSNDLALSAAAFVPFALLALRQAHLAQGNPEA